MIKLSVNDISDIVCGMSDEYEVVQSDIECQDDWACTWFYVISFEGRFYGFYLEVPSGQNNTIEDLNSFPIECFEVEVDPTPRYRKKLCL